MEKSRIIVSIILMIIGLFFFFNNKNIGKGAYMFYKWFYTKNNLTIMFKFLGVFLVIAGIILLYTK